MRTFVMRSKKIFQPFYIFAYVWLTKKYSKSIIFFNLVQLTAKITATPTGYKIHLYAWNQCNVFFLINHLRPKYYILTAHLSDSFESKVWRQMRDPPIIIYCRAKCASICQKSEKAKKGTLASCFPLDEQITHRAKF